MTYTIYNDNIIEHQVDTVTGSNLCDLHHDASNTKHNHAFSKPCQLFEKLKRYGKELMPTEQGNCQNMEKN